MLGSHFELLRKALKHGPFRLLIELSNGLSEVARLIECRHADTDVDHKFFINWACRHEETPPCLDPDGELHSPLAGRKEITVLSNANPVMGSMVLQHQIVCPRDWGKIVIPGFRISVGKAEDDAG